jgi:hypothetical protein
LPTALCNLLMTYRHTNHSSRPFLQHAFFLH